MRYHLMFFFLHVNLWPTAILYLAFITSVYNSINSDSNKNAHFDRHTGANEMSFFLLLWEISEMVQTERNATNIKQGAFYA